MKIIFLAALILLIITPSFTQENKENIYSGGMLFIQPGFVIAENGHQKIENINYGLGGILRFYLNKGITLGIYGGTQRTKYQTMASDNSYLTLGYGGPVVGFSKKINKFRYSILAFVGPGTIRNLHIETQDNSLLINAHFYKKSTVVYSPIISVDYSLTPRLSVTANTVCIMANFDEENKFYNPALQLGLLFNR